MQKKAAGIIFSSLNSNTLNRLTTDRTVAAIPFACRYRLVDFALSALVNANISDIFIVSNYNFRSLVEHIGSGKDWDLARRNGGIKVVSPYQTAVSASAKLYKSHMEALRSMQVYLSEIKEEYVILMDSNMILNINLSDVIAEHEKSSADVTFVTVPIAPDYVGKSPRMMIAGVADKITDIALSTAYLPSNPQMSANIFVMKTDYLRSIIMDAEAYAIDSLTESFVKNHKHKNYRMFRADGYSACIASFQDYFTANITLATKEEAVASLLGRPELPIFTKVHNSAPTSYAASAKVSNSLIADDCVIEGTVENSVLFRGVKVEKGAIVRNCVLFRGTVVAKDASVNCIVSDKDVYIGSGINLSGSLDMPFYIPKSKHV